MKFLLLISFFAVLSCATPYQKLGTTGGYSDQKISENIYSVSFYGNGETDKATVMNYFLLRSAEVTKGAGYKYFYVDMAAGKSLRDLVDDESTLYDKYFIVSNIIMVNEKDSKTGRIYYSPEELIKNIPKKKSRSHKRRRR